jgi:hypothetical protein
MSHEVSVAADGWVLVLSCSCGSLREELADGELPVLDVTRRAAEHQAAAGLQEDMLAHVGRGHWQRVQSSGVGMVMVCSCTSRWPLAVVL